MSSTHYSNPIPVQSAHLLRCLRHHASMAACDDCREARTARIERQRETTRAAS